MPRRSRIIPRRKIAPDPVYNSVWVHKFINKVMWDGKKSVAEKIFYRAMVEIEQKLKKAPLPVFEQAVKNVIPLMETKSRRVGGATYQVPVEVPGARGVNLAMQWLRSAARARAGHSMEEKLAAELMEAASGTGAAMKKRDDVHKIADSNKAFAHFRW